jgi:hypothetical protein
MSLVPRYIGIDDTLEAYESKAVAPYWSLWDKTAIIDQYRGDDMNEGAERLTKEIERSIKLNYENPLTLRLHPTKEKNYTIKSEANAVILFLCSDRPAHHVGNVGVDSNYYLMLNQINSLKSEVEALKIKKIEEENDEDEYEDDGASNLIGGMNQLLQHPIVIGLIDKWLTGKAPVTHLAGVNRSLEECLETLFSKGVTVEHLQKLADMDKAKINMLIQML